jgi:hypothetical protein
MNRKQIIMLWIGIAIIVLMCLFPPWLRVIEIEGSRTISRCGYYSLFNPPVPLMGISQLKHYNLEDKNFPFKYDGDLVNRNYNCDLSEQSFGVDYVRVDLQRLGIQCAIVALITVGLLFTFTTKAKWKSQEQKSGE